MTEPKYKETTSFEIYLGQSDDSVVEVRCPMCGGILNLNDEGVELLADLEGDCDDCGRHFFGYLKLVIEWA